MNPSISDILARIDSISEGLGPEQRAVKQLPALFKPKDISTVLGEPYKKHPMDGELVGEETESQGVSPVEAAITRRIVHGRPELLMQYGLDAVMAAISDEAEWVGHTNLDEIGSSDVSAWVNNIARRLAADAEHNSQVKTEDVVANVKKQLGDMLKDVAHSIASSDLKSPEEKSKGSDNLNQVVKTMTTDDGKEIKIHGNEDDGFRISIRNNMSKSKFNNLDEAVMAVEMFCSRTKQK